MIERFLRAKHWQLFMLTFGIPLILQIGLFISIIVTSVTSDGDPDTSFFLFYVLLFPVLMILFTAVFFGWFWSIVTGLHHFIPHELQLNQTRFKVFFFIPLVYIILITIFMTGMFSGLTDGSIDANNEPEHLIFAVFFPIHIFSMFCIFHSLYFVAKTVKTAELQRSVTFSDFAGEFFLIWFYPIGIWIVQPKINTIVEG